MLMLFWLIWVAAQAPRTDSTGPIGRVVLADNAGFQVVRETYAPGAAAPAGPHGFDLVLVPLASGLSVELDGRTRDAAPGITILIPRGAPHAIRNASSAPVAVISVRRLGDAIVPPPPLPQTSGVTIVRNEESKYVRAITLRFERGGTLRGPGAADTGPTVFVLAADADLRVTMPGAPGSTGRKPAGSAWLCAPGTTFELANTGNGSFEVVRITGGAAR